MFLISNKKATGLIRASENRSIYIKKDSSALEINNEKYYFIFEGYLYPDISYTPEKIAEFFLNKNNLKKFKKFKGRYSGFFYNKINQETYFFNDQLGLNDLFYYKKNHYYIISNKFVEILNYVNIKKEDLDFSALNEFLLFQYPLFDKTFLKNLKLAPLASVYSLQDNKIIKNNFWEYELKTSDNFKPKQAIKELDELLNRATQRIKLATGEKSTFGLGLSGGRDSRLTAHYALNNNLNVKTYIFGEPGSEAYNISNKTSSFLNTNHYPLGFSKNFSKFFKKSISWNPMMPLIYSWYYPPSQNLPKLDNILTGFNGDNQFGSHLPSFKNIDDEQIIKELFKKYSIKNDALLKKINKEELFLFLKQKNLSSANKWENFNFCFRQLKFIKNNPAFNFFGDYNSFSIFTDIDVVEFLLSIPFEWKKELKFYNLFSEKINSNLFKIKQERKSKFNNIFFKKIENGLRYLDVSFFKTNFIYKKSHKHVWRWLINNNDFYNDCLLIIEENEKINSLFPFLDLKKELNLINNGKSKNISLFFRLLTLKLFINSFISFDSQ